VTGCEKVLARLRQGPASHLELYQLGVIAHSRIADLRRKGHTISCEKKHDLYEYTLLEEGDPVETSSPDLSPATQTATSESASPSSSSEAHDLLREYSSPGEAGPDLPPLVPGQLSLLEAAA
jgi:hypothetical protein